MKKPLCLPFTAASGASMTSLGATERDARIFLELRTAVRDVSRLGNGLRVGADRIDTRVERQLCDSIIAAVCAAFDRSPTEFTLNLVLLPGSNGTGQVLLVVAYTGSEEADVTVDALREFCNREIVERMEEVHATAQRVAAGVLPEALNSEPANGTGSREVEASREPVEEDRVLRGQVARETMSRELVERLPGKAIPVLHVINEGEAPQQIGGMKINRPQRRVSEPAEVELFGYINVLSRSPSQVEIITSARVDQRPTAVILQYKFNDQDPRFDELVELYRAGPRARVRIVAEKIREEGVGVQKTHYTLQSIRRLEACELSSLKAA